MPSSANSFMTSTQSALVAALPHKRLSLRPSLSTPALHGRLPLGSCDSITSSPPSQPVQTCRPRPSTREGGGGPASQFEGSRRLSRCASSSDPNRPCSLTTASGNRPCASAYSMYRTTYGDVGNAIRGRSIRATAFSDHLLPGASSFFARSMERSGELHRSMLPAILGPKEPAVSINRQTISSFGGTRKSPASSERVASWGARSSGFDVFSESVSKYKPAAARVKGPKQSCTKTWQMAGLSFDKSLPTFSSTSLPTRSVLQLPSNSRYRLADASTGYYIPQSSSLRSASYRKARATIDRLHPSDSPPSCFEMAAGYTHCAKPYADAWLVEPVREDVAKRMACQAPPLGTIT